MFLFNQCIILIHVLSFFISLLFMKSLRALMFDLDGHVIVYCFRILRLWPTCFHLFMCWWWSCYELNKYDIFTWKYLDGHVIVYCFRKLGLWPTCFHLFMRWWWSCYELYKYDIFPWKYQCLIMIILFVYFLKLQEKWSLEMNDFRHPSPSFHHRGYYVTNMISSH